MNTDSPDLMQQKLRSTGPPGACRSKWRQSRQPDTPAQAMGDGPAPLNPAFVGQAATARGQPDRP
eukprot:7264919-Alexandrium_andersonii.AAC.1